MVAITGSQSAPAPPEVPFRFVSRTIGQGAYAYIRKATPRNASSPVFAVKIVDHEHAFQRGRLSPRQLKTELSLHKYLGKHQNIIQCFSFGETAAFTWIAMELADGGDLFDKIEADEGVGVDVAHFYFAQLVSAISYMHSMGVAHRDIKPENMLLSGGGDLKLADFGLAALYQKDGKARRCTSVCGSPPYIAPEIVGGSSGRGRTVEGQESPKGYLADIADIWSCGVVLFVLLVGNTPWDEPTARSWEFTEYVKTQGRTTDELWEKLPDDVRSLLRGLLKLDPCDRFSLDGVRKHPWFTRANPHLSPAGTAANPVGLATQMLESLRIDFSADPTRTSSSQPWRSSDPDSMDIDDMPGAAEAAAGFAAAASTQPETPLTDSPFDWERPPRPGEGISASQPVTTRSSAAPAPRRATGLGAGLRDAMLADDPALSQFTPTPSVPLSLTQAARRFADIVPAHSLARFLSLLPTGLLQQRLSEALHRLGVPVAPFTVEGAGGGGGGEDEWGTSWVRVKTVDGRSQGLNGTIVVEKIGRGLAEVRFVKAKGDPLEWRRFFKKVVVLCKEAIFVPE